MREAWIIDTARTPRGIGKPGQGALSSVHAQRILSTVLRALQARNGLNTDDIDEVIMGCFAKSGEQDGCIAGDRICRQTSHLTAASSNGAERDAALRPRSPPPSSPV